MTHQSSRGINSWLDWSWLKSVFLYLQLDLKKKKKKLLQRRFGLWSLNSHDLSVLVYVVSLVFGSFSIFSLAVWLKRTYEMYSLHKGSCFCFIALFLLNINNFNTNVINCQTFWTGWINWQIISSFDIIIITRDGQITVQPTRLSVSIFILRMGGA